METNKKMIDPINGSDLIKVGENLYQSEGTGYYFTYDDKLNCFIPNYIPDDELFELAHREGDYLVGDVTGNKYQIDKNGKILTPREISFQIMQQEKIEKLQKYYDDKVANIELKAKENERLIELGSKKDSWLIENGIIKNKLANDSTLNDYLEETIKIRNREVSWPMLYEFKFDGDKCYYCSFEIIPRDLKKTFSLSNDECIQNIIFDDDNKFKEEFFDPFIKYHIDCAQGGDLREMPSNYQDVGNFCLITTMGDMIIMRGIDRKYIDDISQFLNCNEESLMRNSVKR